jgi:alkylhydroperoxidase/carboxymuconolactone decarboxylase family protein YurZ
VSSEQDQRDLRVIADLARIGDFKAFDFLAALNADNLQESGLDPKTHTLVRFAALVAIGGAPLTWALHTDATEPDLLPGPELVGMLIAIAPIVGTAKVTSAIAEFGKATQLGDALAEMG